MVLRRFCEREKSVLTLQYAMRRAAGQTAEAKSDRSVRKNAAARFGAAAVSRPTAAVPLSVQVAQQDAKVVQTDHAVTGHVGEQSPQSSQGAPRGEEHAEIRQVDGTVTVHVAAQPASKGGAPNSMAPDCPRGGALAVARVGGVGIVEEAVVAEQISNNAAGYSRIVASIDDGDPASGGVVGIGVKKRAAKYDARPRVQR
jgi:hypothetical protein